MLPPKDHLLNPIKMFHSTIHLKLSRVTKLATDEYGRKIPRGPMTFEECKVSVSTLLQDLKGKPDFFAGCYSKRALGGDLSKRMSNSREAQKAVIERREVLINEKFNDFEDIFKFPSKNTPR